MLIENANLKEALERYITSIEKREYFKAHESLEEAWHYMRRKKDPLVNLVKGLINGAIAFEHIKRDRVNAKNKALKVIKSFDRYKELYNYDVREAKLLEIASNLVEEKRLSYNIY